MAKIFGELERAQAEQVAALPSGFRGRIVYLTTTDGSNLPGFYFHDGSSWRSVASLDAAQTLSNKTFSDAVTLAEISTPSTPASGFAKLYAKSDNFLYQLDDNGVERRVGAGSGQGVKNYITNGDFETSTTSGWSLFNTTLTSGKPTGSISAGAASVTTFAVTSSSPLAGTYSLNTASSGAWSAGQGMITDAFTIDEEDRGAVLRFSMSFEAVSGSSNINASGTTSNTFGLWVYDVTNSQWVEMVGTYSMISTNGKLMAEVQLPTTCTSARVAVLCVNASAGAVSMNWDSAVFGPREIARGSVVTDPVSYSPTVSGLGAGSGTTVAYWSRVGKFAHIEIQFTKDATPGSGTTAVTFTLPSGMSMDTSVATVESHGFASLSAATFTLEGPALVSGNLIYVRENTTSNNFRGTDLGANVILSIKVKIPVQGWSSNAIASSDFGGRVIAARARRASSNQTISTTALTTLVFNSISEAFCGDTVSGMNTSTGEYTIKETGWYVAEACAVLTGVTSGDSIDLPLRVTSAVHGTITVASVTDSQASTSRVINTKSGDLYLTSGDIVFVQVDSGTSTGYAFANNAASFFSIKKIQSPQAMMGGEVVRARYTSSAAQSITNGATPIIVDFGTKDFDSHNAVTTGASWKFTAQQAGTYVAKCRVHYASATFTSANVLSAYIYKNGVSYSREFYQLSTTGSQVPGVGIEDLVSMNAGDYIDFRLQHDEATARLLRNTGAEVYCYIEKVN